MRGRDAFGASVMAALYLSVFAAAELWARRGAPRHERPRKLVHVGCGVLTLFLPRFVDSPRAAFGLAALFVAICFAGRRLGALRCLAIRRPSWGSEIYPLALFIVFLEARDRMWLYAGSILTLALADAAAALVGVHGTRRYAVGGETRTLEGSAAFLAIAFPCLWLPMLWLGPFGWSASAAAAGLAALLATGLEAVSPRGLDNLLVPVGVCVVLPRLVSWCRALGF